MRIIVGAPPINDPRGFVQTMQNRQSKIFSVGEEAAIFPCVMAWAATLLKQDGHEVIWCDAQTQGEDWSAYKNRLECFEPNLILWEAKTPSIKPTWEAVRKVKDLLPACQVVLCGDHVTALPEETLANSPTDYVLLGGDYDKAIRALCRELPSTSSSRIYDYGTQESLSDLPPIDRELCRWKDYARMGNYLYGPGTHGYSARDCWWRKKP